METGPDGGDRKKVGQVERVKENSANVTVAVTWQASTPSLNRIDGLEPACEPEILDLLHHEPSVLVQAVKIFIEADDVAGILGKLNVTGSRDSHGLLGVLSHRLGIDVDCAVVRFEDLVF